ncbi:MAG: alpha-amylase family glycosyl hydrolase [Runella sp.]
MFFYLRIWLIVTLSLCSIFLFAQTPQPILKDIFLEESPSEITIRNSQLVLTFDKKNGNWTSFRLGALPTSLFESATLPSVDFVVNGQAIVQNKGAKLTGYTYSIQAERQAATLHLHLQTLDSSYQFRCDYTVFVQQPSIERRAYVLHYSTPRAGTALPAKFEMFVFRLPPLRIGALKDCVFDAPGPFFVHNFVAPHTPFDSIRHRTIHFHSAPEAGFGLMAFSNPKLQTTLCSWMSTAGEVNYGSSIQTTNEGLEIVHHNHRAYYWPQGLTIHSDTQHIYCSKDLLSGLAQYRQSLTKTLPMANTTPQWVQKAVILEVYPNYFKGGFKEIAQRLPFYKSIGFNTIYLMPHWLGGYSPIDPFVVDPKFGTSEDLKNLVKKAHQLGMRFLFDMVIHGFHAKNSPILQSHASFFCRDDKGQIALHPTWKSATPDWANPDYQKYMVNLVLHDLKTYGIDGYRVDAASYKGPNWDPNLPYPAYSSGTYAPQLMQKMLDALRTANEDAVLLSEVFGPAFYTVSNFSHDNQTEAVQFILEKMEKGTYHAAQYQQYLANVYAMLPQGANRVIFARNHDTSWFYHFNGYTPTFLNMDAIHAFFGVPEVFAGDPKYPHNPDDDPKVFDFYRKLYTYRNRYDELTTGRIILDKVVCDNPDVFVGIRQTAQHTSLVVISLSNAPQQLHIDLPSEIMLSKKNIYMSDCRNNQAIPAQQKGSKLAIKIQPFAVLHTRL